MENPLLLLAAQLSVTMGDGWRKQLIPLRKEGREASEARQGDEENHLKCLKSISACLSALKGGGEMQKNFGDHWLRMFIKILLSIILWRLQYGLNMSFFGKKMQLIGSFCRFDDYMKIFSHRIPHVMHW